MPKLVKMHREKPIKDGGPTTADVHPDEVENYKASGWRVGEAETASEGDEPKRAPARKK